MLVDHFPDPWRSEPSQSLLNPLPDSFPSNSEVGPDFLQCVRMVSVKPKIEINALLLYIEQRNLVEDSLNHPAKLLLGNFFFRRSIVTRNKICECRIVVVFVSRYVLIDGMEVDPKLEIAQQLFNFFNSFV